MLVTQVQGLVTEDRSQPSRRPETGAESATHEDTGTPGHVRRGERSASANQRTGSGGGPNRGQRCHVSVGFGFFLMQ